MIGHVVSILQWWSFVLQLQKLNIGHERQCLACPSQLQFTQVKLSAHSYKRRGFPVRRPLDSVVGPNTIFGGGRLS